MQKPWKTYQKIKGDVLIVYQKSSFLKPIKQIIRGWNVNLADLPTRNSDINVCRKMICIGMVQNFY